MANSSGWTPVASTAWTACKPGTTLGMAGPVNSWINWPKIVSSCGGRPTTVKGQIGFGPVIDVVDFDHRIVVGQAVIAQMIAERPFGKRATHFDRAGQGEIGLGINRQFAGPIDHVDPPAGQRAANRQFAHSLGQRHHGGQRSWRAIHRQKYSLAAAGPGPDAAA